MVYEYGSSCLADLPPDQPRLEPWLFQLRHWEWLEKNDADPNKAFGPASERIVLSVQVKVIGNW